ncbi:transposase [Bacillus toyonensis]|uniref:DUF6262 family protein n=1 Tax=Bacillus toyonensis TaxID=155322 RepID=UPI000BFCE17F|nr:DUF6262 family protein [Bacillus toyonensis]PHG04748.1 transposase [Bacillus toyonensis]
MNHKRNTDGVLKHAMNKSKETSTRVENAIKKAVKERARINFNSIATSANVSKSYLYNNKDFRVRIETLRSQQNEVKNVKSIKHNTSEQSKDIIIEALRHKVKELEKENKRLTGENKLLLGKLYDKL